MSLSKQSIAALLLHLTVSISAHGHDGGMENMDMSQGHQPAPSNASVAHGEVVNYTDLSAHSSLMMAHIGMMVLAWFFILPVGESSLQCDFRDSRADNRQVSCSASLVPDIPYPYNSSSSS